MKTASFARRCWRLSRHQATLSLLSFVVAVFNSSAQNADFIYTNNNGTITITKYIGSGGDVTIPGAIDGLPVTVIGNWAFFAVRSLRSVTIPDSVTSIEVGAFYACFSLTNVTLPRNLLSIGGEAFRASKLSTVAIPSSVTNLEPAVFLNCYGLSAITVDALNPNYISVEGVLFNKSQTTILEYPGGRTGSYQVPDTVMLIGEEAFFFCTNLAGVYFSGNAPGNGGNAFLYADKGTVYYLSGTTGWDSTFGGRPTALWVQPNPVILNLSPGFGVQTNVFGFVISWATNASVVVEASTTLANPIWLPVGTNILTIGSSYFSDPEWTNYPSRFYRVRSM